MVKKGDTLIEVVLAIGIFSMIAIAVVAVMSGGTSSSQTALETSLARNEIDSQAESLRFIHNSYIAEKNSASTKYQDLWEAITASAIEASDDEGAPQAPSEEFLQFAPESCSALYESDEIMNHAFAIDYGALGDYLSATTSEGESPELTPFVKARDNLGNDSGKLKPATTYPRLVYTQKNKDQMNSNSSDYTAYLKSLYQVEGIFIVGVKDAGNTNIVNKSASTSAYYDFYIRTCWYGANANEPSTISTVIRLYDPKAIE